jgi:hypothetical protein
MRMSLRTARFARVQRPLGAVVLAALCLIPAALATSAQAAIPAAAPALKKNDKAGVCIALTVKNGKLVPLKQSVYRYRFVRISKGRNKGKFRRKIILANVQVKTSCITQCVQLRKKGKSLVPTYKVRRIKVKEPRRGRLVTVKRLRRVWLLGPCASLPSIESLGTPVTVSVLEKSSLTFDFSAFKREAPLTGQLKGYIPGRIQEGADNQVILTSGALDLAKTTIFNDTVCGGQATDSIRTAEPSRLRLEPGKQSTITLGENGTVNALTYMVLDLALELRNGDDGCKKSYLVTGYSSVAETVRMSGSVGAQGLAQVPLKMPSADVDLLGCLSPGLATQPCSGFEVPLPASVSMNLAVAVVANEG